MSWPRARPAFDRRQDAVGPCQQDGAVRHASTSGLRRHRRVSAATRKRIDPNGRLARLPARMPQKKAAIAIAEKMARMTGPSRLEGGMPGESGHPILTTRPGTEFAEGVSSEADGGEFRDRSWGTRSQGRLRENHISTPDQIESLATIRNRSRSRQNRPRPGCIALRGMTHARTIRRLDEYRRTT